MLVPHTGLAAADNGGGFTEEVAASLWLREHYRIDVGAMHIRDFGNADASGFGGILRVGTSRRFIDDRRARGSEVRIPLLLEYRAFRMSSSSRDGGDFQDAQEDFHMIAVQTGLEFRRWWKGIGIVVQLHGGLGVTVFYKEKVRSSYRGIMKDYVVNNNGTISATGGIALGLSFGL